MDRLALFPSRANLVAIKLRIAAANKGLNLLKRKRDALEIRLRALIRELDMSRDDMQITMNEAIFSLAKADFLKTDLKPAAVSCPERADAYFRVKYEKIVGAIVPSFSLFVHQSKALPLTGLSAGGRQIERVRDNFQEALKIITKLASLEFSVKILSLAVHQTNMRVNGLELVVTPRLQNTYNYIRDELEELDREDFYRLKCSQAKNRKKKRQLDELRQAVETTV